MRTLVDQLRSIVANKSVGESEIAEIKQALAHAIPRLKERGLCESPCKPGRYLCYRDPQYGFVVMILVWGPGDGTPIHDHGTWGVEGILRHHLRVTTYNTCEEKPEKTGEQVLGATAIMHNLPPARDVHKVEHASGDYAMSLHIYGSAMTKNRSFIPGRGYTETKLECITLELPDLKGYHGWEP